MSDVSMVSLSTATIRDLSYNKHTTKTLATSAYLDTVTERVLKSLNSDSLKYYWPTKTLATSTS